MRADTPQLDHLGSYHAVECDHRGCPAAAIKTVVLWMGELLLCNHHYNQALSTLAVHNVREIVDTPAAAGLGMRPYEPPKNVERPSRAHKPYPIDRA